MMMGFENWVTVSGVDASLYLTQDDATLITQDDSTQVTVE